VFPHCWSFCHFRSSTSPCPEGSFLAPEISRLFGDTVGASLVSSFNIALWYEKLHRRPCGVVGRTTGGGSIPRWSAGKPQVWWPVERQWRRPQKKKWYEKLHELIWDVDQWVWVDLLGDWFSFEYSLKRYFALWQWTNAFRSIRSWVEILWFHRSRKDFDFLKEYESNWDGWGSLIAILDLASYIWDVGEAYLIAFCEYVRYSDIVRTMPTYLLWPLGIWSGSLFWPLSLWLIADVWLLWWANYFSAMTADDWILAEKRRFYSPR